MSIFMTLRIALKALNRNKMRTMLTMLGVIIGVSVLLLYLLLPLNLYGTIFIIIIGLTTQFVALSTRIMTSGIVYWRRASAEGCSESPDAPSRKRTPAGFQRRRSHQVPSSTASNRPRSLSSRSASCMTPCRTSSRSRWATGQ